MPSHSGLAVGSQPNLTPPLCNTGIMKMITKMGNNAIFILWFMRYFDKCFLLCNSKERPVTRESIMSTQTASLRQEAVQCLDMIGGATQSVFPLVEALLLRAKYANALQYVRGKRHIGGYLSFLDHLFGELYPVWDKAIKIFYQDKGPALKHLTTVRDWDNYQLGLLLAIQMACVWEETGRKPNWKKFLYEAREAISNQSF